MNGGRAALPEAWSRGGDSGVLRAGPVFVDLSRRRVTVDGNRVELTATELGLLQTLLEARGQVVPRETLLARVWGEAGERIGPRTVDVHVSRLRRKLGSEGRRIATVRKVGYRFGLVGNWVRAY